MIRVELYYKQDVLVRFKLSGHAGYGEHGEDIVCSAVSMLVINTINAIEALTTETLSLNGINQSQGLIDCTFPKRSKGNENKEATLLLESLLMGLRSVKQMYGEYIVIKDYKL